MYAVEDLAPSLIIGGALGQRIGDAQAWVHKRQVVVEVWAAELDVAQVAQQQRKIVHGLQLTRVRDGAQLTAVKSLFDGRTGLG